MFGFLIEDGKQAFFHLRVFRPGPNHTETIICPNCTRLPCEWLQSAPPPIVGEFVDAYLEIDPTKPENVRASRVDRVIIPVPMTGIVETFDVPRGYGFIRGGDGLTYYLHRSEVVEGRIPISGQRVMFHTSERRDKARACHVKICLLAPQQGMHT